MKTKKKITIVDGFLGVEAFSKNRLIRPSRRIAVVTETYDPQVEGSFRIDVELIAKVCQLLCAELDYEISFSGEKETLRNLDSEVFIKKLSGDLFETLIAKSEHGVQLQIDGAPWYKVGGASPYHDSATLEIYCWDERHQSTLNKLMEFFDRQSLEVEFVEGVPVLDKKNWLKDLIGWWLGLSDL